MIVRDVDRPRDEDVEALKDVSPNDVGHHFHFGFTSPEVQYMETAGEVNVVGPVVTARIPPEDSTMVHKITELAEPGDVIVVDMEGHTHNAPWGEMTTRAAMASGVVGAVIDGSITDSREIRELGFPVYARGRNGRTTRLHGRGGDINVRCRSETRSCIPVTSPSGTRTGFCSSPKLESTTRSNSPRESRHTRERRLTLSNAASRSQT